MPLVLYNSLTRRKEPFVPIDDKNVRMYVCGPTVYDTAHIGNARAVVVFDALYRLLRHEYGVEHVKYVRNITDIDDKIIDAARANNEPIAALTERTTATFHADMDALGALRPDAEPRCTAHVPPMIAMIERLIAAGHAYAAEGHVLFSVASWPRYGRLSRRSRQELVAGARVEVAPYKRDPGDFVLWKPSAPEQPGWESPWGRGRPGWHIECSAMSEAHLGEHFDIHGGGLDLIFPHHENELAQSEAAHDGRPFVNLWMHNGFLSVDSTKMSKSLGNFTTAHELLQEWTGEVIRLALLSTHYRDPLDWTEQKLHQALVSLDRFYTTLAIRHTTERLSFARGANKTTPIDSTLDDDLNTPLAISKMHDISRRINSIKDEEARKSLLDDLQSCGDLLGLLQHDPQRWRHGRILVVYDAAVAMEFSGTRPDNIDKKIEDQISIRALARKERRFAEADAIRDELAAEGIVLEDKPDGTTEWRRA